MTESRSRWYEVIHPGKVGSMTNCRETAIDWVGRKVGVVVRVYLGDSTEVSECWLRTRNGWQSVQTTTGCRLIPHTYNEFTDLLQNSLYTFGGSCYK